jgi:hypothetical protein
MSLRQGIVVGVHPDDYSVDLVMVDDGSRVVGVQVLTSNGSGRSGMFDMPTPPARASKWDIATAKEGEQIAIVGYMRGNPVVLGYMYPKNSEMTFRDGKRALYRHQSDVTVSIEETGAMNIKHPGGLAISIGTPANPRLEPQSAAGNYAPIKNKGEKLNFSITFPGFTLFADEKGLNVTANKITFGTPSQGGDEPSFSLVADGDGVRLKAEKITFDTPEITTGAEVKVGTLKTKGDVLAGGLVKPNTAQSL